MKCAHCTVEFHSDISAHYIGKDMDGIWLALSQICPKCNKLIVYLHNVVGNTVENTGGRRSLISSRVPSEIVEYMNSINEIPSENIILVRPKISTRPPCPSQVPKEIAEDYTEACLTLADSSKASAALSRRCLQNILRDPNGANAQQKNLVDQIESVLNSRTLPTYIANDIDAIRNIGNFAAHPTKSQAMGTILSTEPGEAEWNLNVIEALFDFYYVQPEISQMKRNALNAKLQSAGKLPMK